MSDDADDKTMVTDAYRGEDVLYKKARPHEGREPFLVVKSGADKGKKILILAGVTTIGRASRNIVQLKDPLVSATHAEIRVEEGRLVLHDLDSANGSLVNGERVKTKILEDGTRLDFGTTELVLVVPKRGVRG